MAIDDSAHGSAAQWLRYAIADLAIARMPLPVDGLLELHSFHAQQATEKSLKAVLVHCGVAFTKTHSIEHLIDCLPSPIERTNELLDAASLTIYATQTRYPGDDEAEVQEEHDAALAIAERIVRWARNVIESGSP